jgi:hypothetical protein
LQLIEISVHKKMGFIEDNDWDFFHILYIILDGALDAGK